MAKKKLTKTWPYCKTTPAGIPVRHTTGYLAFNDSIFNKLHGTDGEDEILNGTGGTVDLGVSAGCDSSTSTSGGEASGSIAEALTLHEAKREVRRYYLKPQSIWCSNKAEVLKALIDIGTNDCVIYTLKNLTDNDDIHKLSDRDIIYYYEDGILYDKNHVRVMDYDLVIKHEEERPKLSDNATDSAFRDAYEDRITDQTVVENIEITEEERKTLEEFLEEDDMEDNFENIVTCTWCGEKYPDSDCKYERDMGWLCNHCASAIASRGEELDFVINPAFDENGKLVENDSNCENCEEKLTENQEEPLKLTKAELQDYLDTHSQLIIGHNYDDADIVSVQDEQYSCTEYEINSYGDRTYSIGNWFIGHHGEMVDGDVYETFKSFEDLWSYILANDLINLEESPLIVESIEEPDDADAFFLEYDTVDAFGEVLTEDKTVKKYTCCICGEEFEGNGNNPDPYKNSGKCCDACNNKFVIPARMNAYQEEYTLDAEVEDKDFDEALQSGDFSKLVKEAVENPDEAATDDLFVASDKAKSENVVDNTVDVPPEAEEPYRPTESEMAEIAATEDSTASLLDDEIAELVRDQIV